MKTADIPGDILANIPSAATDAWPGDREMREWTIEQEVASYRTMRDLDFGAATAVREAILTEADGYSDTWEDRSNFIEEEVDAYNALLDLDPDDVPPEIVSELKVQAARHHDWFSLQLEVVAKGIDHHRYVQRTRARIEPIRHLLVEMERIIGSECYNGNVQNYSAWGVWEGEGRSFRYPQVSSTETRSRNGTSARTI